ncbi:hypothetical protein UVI_02018660 [Ustilaginoidea virens]|nr:hypothetical protein UVI_02018660 [Ustilaginoidea virens]
MGLLGISLLVASVVYVIVRPPGWLWLARPFSRRPARHPAPVADVPGRRGSSPPAESDPDAAAADDDDCAPAPAPAPPATKGAVKPPNGSAASAGPVPSSRRDAAAPPDSPTTPKASAATPAQQVPILSLSQQVPAPHGASVSASASASPCAPSTLMPPPPLPPPLTRRLPSLAQFPAANSAQRARGPVPGRAPLALEAPGGLAPPPTISSRPQKPSRKVTLEPGHSPLDWARVSGPDADLRGVVPGTSYLRVTPSMLRRHTGRLGRDAWMALNGKVYNITPYANFHPGGVPELMRGAARDGTKLFGEVHPWVNYETMLASCLVGLLVDEPQATLQESDMDRMD